MEEEEDEEEEPPLPTSDLGGVPWKEAVRIHALLKGKSEEEADASRSREPGEEEEEQEEEEEEDEEEEEEEEEDYDAESSEGEKTIPPTAALPSLGILPACDRGPGLGSCAPAAPVQALTCRRKVEGHAGV